MKWIRLEKLVLIFSQIFLMANGMLAQAGEQSAVGQIPADADSLGAIPDLEEVLAELQEAGVVPSPEEMRLLLDQPRPKEDRATSHGKEGRRRGKALIRMEPTDGEGWDPRASVRGQYDLVRLRVRYRNQPDAPRDYRGYLAVGSKALELRMGDLGYAWGCGLLSSAPGRGPSLAAGSSLASWRAGPASGGSGFEKYAVTGLTLAAGAGGWRMGALAGCPQDGELSTRPTRGLLMVRKESGNLGLGVLLSRSGPEEGMSFTGDLKGELFAGGWESAQWRSSLTGATGRAWAGHLGWVGSKRIGAEGILVGSSAGEPAHSGRRPVSLPTADGQGWAIRSVVKPSRGGTMRFLLARGLGHEEGGLTSRRSQDLADMEGRWQAGPTFWLSVRWRQRSETKFVWSERFPWEPATAEPEGSRRVLSLSGVHERPGRICRLLFRSQVDGGQADSRRRKLVQATGKWTLRKGWKWRAAWATAWGGDADLVSAISPMSGLVLPRHWGHWQSESVLGLEYSIACWAWQGALSRRLPVPEQGREQTWTVWIKTECTW